MATRKSSTKRASGRSSSSRASSKKTTSGSRNRSGSSRSTASDDENVRSRRSSNSGTSRTGTSETSRSTRSGSTTGRSQTRGNTSASSTRSRGGANAGENQRGSSRRASGTVSSNRGSSGRSNNFNEDLNYSEGRGRYGDDYSSGRGERSNDYGYRRREDRMDWQGEEYGNRGRTNYGNDRDSGRNLDRYDNERNERRRSDTRMGWSPESNQGRMGYSSNWDTGSRSGRAFGGSSRGNTGNQEYYTENEWNRQRNQNWNQADNQMEKDDEYRQERGTRRRSIIRPTGKNDEGLRKLLTDQLKDIYWAEKALTKAIPKMIKQSSSAELRNALSEHLNVTESHVRNVEEVFRLLGEKASAKKCEGMSGLIEEANEVISELEQGSVRDAGIICAAQKVEHYEIATYGTLATYADILDEPEIADILEEILEEEKRADKTLTQVAMEINWEAAEESEEEDDEEEDEEDEEEEGITRIKGRKPKKYSELDAIES